MINFTCKCGHQFSVPEDTAGGFVQCPDCRLLVDVPYLSDLQNLEEDGTFKLSPELEIDERAKQDLSRIVGRHQTDPEDSEVYDLRPTPEDIMNAGVEEIPLELQGQVRPGAPKYDPETGELIRPLDLKLDVEPHPKDIPVAKPALDYATGDRVEGVSPWRIPLALLSPGNIAVLAVVFFLHMLNQFFVLVLAGGLFFAAVFPILIAFIIFGHYANIIDEVGRQERDELPGPLRGMSWGEDIWHPFVAFAGASILCYLPAAWALSNLAPPLGHLIALALAGVGTLLFPAVILTTATSGSVFNLRPDRVLAVIRCCAGSYLSVTFLWALAGAVYGTALYGITAHAASMVAWGGAQLNIAPLLAYSLLLAGIYLMHLFAWRVGLLYRSHQPQFPWVLQQHDWSFKDEKELQALRRKRAPRRIRKVQPIPQTSTPAEVPPPSKPRVVIPIDPVAGKTRPIPVKPVAVEPIPVKPEPIPLEPGPIPLESEPIPLEPLPSEQAQPLPVEPLETPTPLPDQSHRLAQAQSHLLNAMRRAEERRHESQQFWKGKNPPTAAGYR